MVKILKMKMDANCRLVAVADENDVVLTAGTFVDDDDTETAVNVIYTLLANLGVIKSLEIISRMSVSELLKAVGKPSEVYSKELTPA